MSRMSAPTMEVVRFKEADVIVASGGIYTTTEGLGDGAVHTFKMTVGENSVTNDGVHGNFYRGLEGLLDLQQGTITLETPLYLKSGQSYLLGNVLSADDTETVDNPANLGDFTKPFYWYAENGGFFRQ